MFKKVKVRNKNFTTQNDNFWQKQDALNRGDSRILCNLMGLKNSEVNGMVFAFSKVVDFRRCDIEVIKEIKRFYTD